MKLAKRKYQPVLADFCRYPMFGTFTRLEKSTCVGQKCRFHTIDTDLYCAPLNQMYVELGRTYPTLVNRKHIQLQQDNAKLHTVTQTKEMIGATENLLHPAYNPDLTPSDYRLFSLHGTHPSRTHIHLLP